MAQQPGPRFRSADNGLFHCDLVDFNGSVIWTTIEPTAYDRLCRSLRDLGIHCPDQPVTRLTIRSRPHSDRAYVRSA
jgi:hypothetical protein